MRFEELLNEGEVYYSGEWDKNFQRIDFKKAISRSRLSIKEIVPLVNKKLGTNYDIKGKNGTKISQDIANLLSQHSKSEKDFKALSSLIVTGKE